MFELVQFERITPRGWIEVEGDAVKKKEETPFCSFANEKPCNVHGIILRISSVLVCPFGYRGHLFPSPLLRTECFVRKPRLSQHVPRHELGHYFLQGMTSRDIFSRKVFSPSLHCGRQYSDAKRTALENPLESPNNALLVHFFVGVTERCVR